MTEVLNDIVDQKMTPILIECGPKTMNEYWKNCKKIKDPVHIEMLYFACF